MADSLNDIIKVLNKKFGDGFVSSAAEMPDTLKIRSSLPAYNYVTLGGFPTGRVVEHYGAQSSTKSYTGYDFIAQFQHYDWANHVQGAFQSITFKKSKNLIKEVESFKLKRGYKPKLPPKMKYAVLIDIEGTYSRAWGTKMGINNDGLIYLCPSRLTEAGDIAQELLKHEDVCFMMLDSMSATGTDEEIDKSMEDQQMAVNARFWNKMCRKLQSSINANEGDVKPGLLMINSAYDKVGFVMGDPEVTRNGKQLQLTKSISVRFRQIKEIKEKIEGRGEIVVGVNIGIQCKKNKLGPKGREANYFYAFEDFGNVKAFKTDTETQLIDLGIKTEIINRSGNTYSFDTLKVTGAEKFARQLSESGLLPKLEEVIYSTIFAEEE